ncbi:MAG TPA: hypothetical protein VFP32_02245 [Candidatus Saccharimonadales bacterium]|nr:hypothetical protein [Candidatus Saccharimonadales bacterium]
MPEDFTDIDASDFPSAAGRHILEEAYYFGNYGVETVQDFYHFMKLGLSGYAIYGAMANQSYQIAADRTVQASNIYLVDYLPDGQIPGHGIVQQSDSGLAYSADKPVVLRVDTYPQFQRQGYGRRRYLAMNAASMLIFGNPLHSRESGPLRSDPATQTWAALEREGLAESYEEINKPGGRLLQRYRFRLARNT